jgi:hypothetical protein
VHLEAMMFLGTVPQPVRSMIREIARSWGDVPVYVGCSGNFTIEHALSDGKRKLHSNDVSLYTCAIGRMLTGQPVGLSIKPETHRWLENFIDSPERAVATILLLLEYGHFSLKDGKFSRRVWQAVEARWQALHDETLEKVMEAKKGIQIASFTACDVVEFIAGAPDDAAAMAFPPTYKGGYERQFKALDEIIGWEPAPYVVFDEGRMDLLVANLRKREHWALYWDRDLPALADYLVGLSQPSALSHQVRIYGTKGRTRVVNPHQKLEQVPMRRLEGTLEGALKLCYLSQGQFNSLRSQYMAVKIAPADASLRFGVIVGDRIAGAFAFSFGGGSPLSGDWCDVYMLSDFAVAPTSFTRLSKLVLASALSKEVQDVLQQRTAKAVNTLGTTAFTDKPVSMKYRGLFDLYSRKPGKLNYVGKAGRWTLSEALDWWMKCHGHVESAPAVVSPAE